MPVQPEGVVAPVTGPQDEAVLPDAVARILATAVVATIMGGVITKLLGKKIGLVAFVLTATAHEMFDAPLARRLSRLGL